MSPLKYSIESRESRLSSIDQLYADTVDTIEKRIIGRKVTGILVYAIKSLRENVLVAAISILACFLLIGILAYKHLNDWSFATAFFYLINTCFNIGFGNVVEVDSAGVHVFSVLMIWVSNTLVMGSIAFLLSYYLLTDSDLLFALLDRGVSSLENTTLRIDLWSRVKRLMGWSTNPSLLRIELLFLVWIAVGTAWGVHYEHWEIMTSIFFAVGTCSTAGLYGSRCRDPATYATAKCDLGESTAVFTGFYALVGVPCKPPHTSIRPSLTLIQCSGSPCRSLLW